MIPRLLLKSSLLGSFGSAAYASIIIDIPDNRDNKPLSPKISDKQKWDFTTDPTKSTVQDIEMFERAKGCKIVFVDKFGENKNYTVREWYKEKMKSDPKRNWRAIFAYGVRYNKGLCQKGQILTLERYGQYGEHLKPKKF